MKLVLGTRGSALARAQSGHVADALRRRGHDVRLEVIETRGDREIKRPVPELGGKGLFTAELADALLSGAIDLAVHSLKDLPTEESEGLRVAAILLRADPRDALVSRRDAGLSGLPRGARVGTASLRRKALLLRARPDVEVAPLRGNVGTRLSRVASGELDAVVLAAAGLQRLGKAERITEHLDFLPAPAQGALAVQARADRDVVLAVVRTLHDTATAACVGAERAMLHELGGGCSVPVGALAVLMADTIRLRGLVAAVDGTRLIEAQGAGLDPEAVGGVVARRLRELGAQELLDALA